MSIKLFPIKLRGEGTSDVESFASYVYRLAFEHGLYVGELIDFVHRNTKKQRDEYIDYPNKLNKLSVADLIRPSNRTKELLEIFQIITCQELRSSTLWFLNKNLGRSSGQVCKGFRWCPECIAEMASLEKQPYMKLIWHMAEITHCPIHKSPLLSQCSQCSCKQTSFKLKHPFGRCQECGEALSKREKRLRKMDITSSWQISGTDLLELFSDLAGFKPEDLPSDGVHRSIEHIFDYYWSQNRENEFYLLLSRDELLAIIHNQTVIGLKRARRIAFKMGISLFTLMSGNAHQSSAILHSEWVCILPTAYESTSNKNKRDHRAVVRKIKRIIQKTNAPSLLEVAKIADVSVGYLTYRFPSLVKTIVSNHKEHIEHETLRRRFNAQAFALAFFVEEKYSSQPKSKRQAYRILREETKLPRQLLKKAIQTAHFAIN